MIDPKHVYSAFRGAFQPLTRSLAAHGVTPNMLTVAGIVLNIAAAALIVMGRFYWAAGVFVAASICDMLDGSVARHAGLETPFGAFLDSTVDRISEGIILSGLGLYFAWNGQYWELVAVFVFLIASFLVSYTRARAEALGLQCKVGLMSRPERIIVLVVGLLFHRWYVLSIAVFAVAFLTSFTVLQRILYVRRQLLRAGLPAADARRPPDAGGGVSAQPGEGRRPGSCAAAE